MAKLVKPWNDGGSLSATYNGSGDGEATFTSDVNEGIDREMSVIFADTARRVMTERKVTQIGLREEFVTSDSLVFMPTDGVFGVLKVGGQPDQPTETYTRLTHIESNGQQYIDLGYVVKEDDVIEANFVLTKIDESDKFLFGVSDGTADLWFEYYNHTAYSRFGHTSSNSVANVSDEYRVILQKHLVTVGSTSASLSYTSMPNSSLFLFAGKSTSGNPYGYGYYRCSLFRITDSNGVVMELIPHRRDSDDAVGLLDTVSGKFYISQEESFIGGGVISDGYEQIEYVTFNGDKTFDTGQYGNNQTSIDLLFKRTDTSGAHYIFGCSSGNRLTGYLTTSGYWRYGNGYPTFNTNNKNLTIAMVKPGATIVGTNRRTFSVSTFTTAFTIPVGGHKPSSGVATPQFKGYLYYFRMSIADEVVVDWLPCKRLSDGVEGFWDCVTNTFIEPM